MSEPNPEVVGPVIRRDGAELVFAPDAETLAGWVESDLVADALRYGACEVWTADGRPLTIVVQDQRVTLERGEGGRDERFRRVMAPLCGRTAEDDAPSFEQIEARLYELNLPAFTLLDLWPSREGRVRASSSDWHRPWEPKHCWTPDGGLQKIPFWRRF